MMRLDGGAISSPSNVEHMAEAVMGKADMHAMSPMQGGHEPNRNCKNRTGTNRAGTNGTGTNCKPAQMEPAAPTGNIFKK